MSRGRERWRGENAVTNWISPETQAKNRVTKTATADLMRRRGCIGSRKMHFVGVW
jgi:hypothetical protein